MQKEGVDFNDIFAPTGNQDSLRLLFAMAAQHNLILHSVDVKTAFLYGILEEDIYLKQPDGCIDPIFPDYVWKLDRSIFFLITTLCGTDHTGPREPKGNPITQPSLRKRRA
jgi:hypothetical protein